MSLPLPVQHTLHIPFGEYKKTQHHSRNWSALTRSKAHGHNNTVLCLHLRDGSSAWHRARGTQSKRTRRIRVYSHSTLPYMHTRVSYATTTTTVCVLSRRATPKLAYHLERHRARAHGERSGIACRTRGTTSSLICIYKRPSARRGPGIKSVDRNVRSKCRCSCVLQFTS